MRSSILFLFTLAGLFSLSHVDVVAVAQAPETHQSKMMTMRPSPGVLVTVLRADALEGVESPKPRIATVLEVTLDPMSGSPPHRHPGPVCGYVLEGTFEFQIEGKEKQVLTVGETFYEPEMVLHQIGRNPSSDSKTRVLATIIHPVDAKQLVILEPQDQAR